MDRLEIKEEDLITGEYYLLHQQNETQGWVIKIEANEDGYRLAGQCIERDGENYFDGGGWGQYSQLVSIRLATMMQRAQLDLSIKNDDYIPFDDVPKQTYKIYG